MKLWTIMLFGVYSCVSPDIQNSDNVKPSNSAAISSVTVETLDTWVHGAPKIAKLESLETIYSFDVSPDGNSLAFVSNREGKPQLYIKHLVSHKLVRVPTLDDQINQVQWSPNGRFLAIQVTPQGGLNNQIYTVNPDGSAFNRITPGGTESTSLSGFSDDGSLLYLSSNRHHEEQNVPFLYDWQSQTSSELMQQKGDSSIVDRSADRRYYLIESTPRRGRQDIVIYDQKTQKSKLITPDLDDSQSAAAFFSRSQSWIYFISNEGSDYLRLLRGPWQSNGKVGKFQEVLALPQAELENMQISRSRRSLLLVWNHQGISKLGIYDIEHDKHRIFADKNIGVVSQVKFSNDERFVYFLSSSPNSPQRISRIRTSDGQFEEVISSQLAQGNLPKVNFQSLEFQGHDGLPLSGWLYTPDQQGAPRGVIVSFHGGPEGQARPVFNPLVSALLEEKFAVFAPNVRGSFGYGKAFMSMDNGALRKNAVADIRACAEVLIKKGIAAPGKLGVMGASYGGYMVMAALTEFPQEFAAGVDLFGIVNFRSFFRHSQPWIVALSKSEYGDPVGDAQLLDELSPIHKIDRLTAPLLIMHGRQDTNVPLEEAEQIVKAMQSRKKPIEFVLFEDEGHGWRNKRNIARSNAAIVHFFKEYFPK